MDNSYMEKLEAFLAGTFHQDIDSPEDALDDYISEVGKEWLQDIVDSAETFLKSEIGLEEKNEFIETNAEIFFPAIQLTPLQWFNSIIERLKKEMLN
ncbi:hypothetical protein JHL18_18770 [Clostridium sp. YIM B02505]|uniref:CdiI immunity protein domain-containing protein n=1 Tax=Clostridium yunnanense TaxID=2800325 RepID=A0ABS1ETG5_9CLOT|nr:contact-dependent growth inhibition system immunity protein [Clostridium yunnanense]MBK1812667.1 hypothetical protein [Clostridium yunnanense]